MKGYESLKSAYLQKFPALSQETTEKAIHEEAPGESYSDDNHEELNKEISILKKDLQESQLAAQAADLKIHNAKRASDLARNKISTATEGLNMYLEENLSKEYFDEFNPAFMFLVSQFSSLLYQPECFTVNNDTNEVTLADNLFHMIKKSDSIATENLKHFKLKLEQKLSLDFSVRKERRNSIGFTRPRVFSTSTKRTDDEKMATKSKIARPSLSD